MLRTSEYDHTQVETLAFHVAPCKCVARHSPLPLTVERHHVFPKALQIHVWGAVRDNETVPLCGTSHNAVHSVIDALLDAQPVVSGHTNHYVRMLAEQAVFRYNRARNGSRQQVRDGQQPEAEANTD
jgi:hypothetical protein